MNPKRTSYNEIFHLIPGIEKICHEKGINIHSKSALGECIEATKKINDSWENGDTSVANSPDFFELLDRLHLCAIIGASVKFFKDQTAFQNKIKLLTEDELAFNISSHSNSRNLLSELIIANIFKQINWQVNWEEPDLIVEQRVNNQTIRFAIACKMLESSKNLEKLLSKAKKQINNNLSSKNGVVKGLIAIDLSQIFNNSVLRTLEFKDGSFITEILADELQRFESDNKRLFDKIKSSNKIIGLLLYSLNSCVIRDEKPMPYSVTQLNIHLFRSDNSIYTSALRMLPDSIK
jgi:hypothetical protein